LDLTDEGLYLLAADPPSPDAAWGFPFGWHTAPLFKLAGYDIASFRTLGAVVLVLLFSWFGWVSVRAVRTVISLDGERSSSSQIPLFAGAITAGTGSLLYYASMLRTPSYNWLNLVGIVITAVSVLLSVELESKQTGGRRKTYRWLLAGLAAFGLFITIPAKPTTLPILFLLDLALLVGILGRRKALASAGRTLALIPAWIVVFVLFRIWPVEFISVFQKAIHMPLPAADHSSLAAISAALLLPRDFARGLSGMTDQLFILLVLAAVLLVTPILFNRAWWILRLFGFALIMFVALGVAGLPLPLVDVIVKPFGLAQTPLTTASLIILFGALVASWFPPLHNNPDQHKQINIRRHYLIVTYVSLLGFVFGFGSGNGIYGQASISAGLFLLAALLTVVGLNPPWAESTLLAAILGVTCVLAAAGIHGGWKEPYRIEALADQSVSTSVGSRGTALLLDPTSSRVVEALRTTSSANGWTPQTPIIDVSYTWHPGIAYFLAGRVPDYLQLTIFGYEAAHDIVNYHLGEPGQNFPYNEAWILTTKNSAIDISAQRAVSVTLDSISRLSNRNFPSGYSCFASGDFVLWKPMNGSEVDSTSASAICNQ